MALGFLAVLMAAYLFAFVRNGWSTNPETWGHLGDYIGGLLSPLVAGLALMALVVGVRLQKAEMAETRKELADSRLAMEQQAKSIEQQRREQRFFDLLNIYSATLNAISFADSADARGVLHVGKHAFRYLLASPSSPLAGTAPLFAPAATGANGLEPQTAPKHIETEWAAVSPLLDHYFRTICLLLKEFEQHFSDPAERKRYIMLFRTQLSSDELNLITMNLLYAPGGQRMRRYVNTSALIKHLPPSYLRELAEQALDPRAFGHKPRPQTTENTPC